jgi:hypothetical protein
VRCLAIGSNKHLSCQINDMHKAARKIEMMSENSNVEAGNIH